MINRPYPADDIIKLSRLVDQGLSYKEIAGVLGRSTGSISGICHYYNIKLLNPSGPRPKPKAPKVVKEKHINPAIEQIRPLVALGLSARRIGEQIGLGQEQVYGLCRRHNMRTRGGPGGRPDHRRKVNVTHGKSRPLEGVG